MLFFLLSIQLYGQRNEADPPVTRQKDREVVNETKIDSINITTYTLDDLNTIDTFKTKGLTKYFQQYDPSRQSNFDYGHLGNLGSSAYPLALKIENGIGLNLGLEHYGLYQKSPDDIIHFKQNSPVSELYFSGGETQSDLRVKALFSRSFANNVNLVINYDRISQDGIYNYQGLKQTSLLTSLAYRPKDSRMSAFFTYIINSGTQEINGGVDDLTDLSTINLRRNVSVFNTDAEDRLENKTLKYDFFYKLTGDSSTSLINSALQYEIEYFNETYRYSDPSIANDSLLYKNYIAGDRGLRNYSQHWRLRNSFFLNSSLGNVIQFKTGISHDYNWIDVSSDREYSNEINLRFKGSTNIKNRLSIDIDAYYGLLDVANEFGLDLNANLALTDNQGFNFLFMLGRNLYNIYQDKLILNESVFYEIEEPKPLILQTLGAEYYNEKLKVRAGGKIQNTFNFLYYDTLALPVINEDLYSVSLLYLNYDLKFKSLLIENFLFLQNQNKRLLNIPTAFTKNSISFYGNIFKDNMLLKAGIDLRYIINPYLPQYQPVAGLFYLNEKLENKPYPLLDARISFKVSSFTTFFKYENITSLFSDEIEFMVLNYPQFDARFRFGIQWNLWN